jgi:hypothetical protein
MLKNGVAAFRRALASENFSAFVEMPRISLGGYLRYHVTLSRFLGIKMLHQLTMEL